MSLCINSNLDLSTCHSTAVASSLPIAANLFIFQCAPSLHLCSDRCCSLGACGQPLASWRGRQEHRQVCDDQRHERHAYREVTGGAGVRLVVFALAQPVLYAEDDGGPGRKTSVSSRVNRYCFSKHQFKVDLFSVCDVRLGLEHCCPSSDIGASSSRLFFEAWGDSYHPMYRLRMKMAAIGKVWDMVEETSGPLSLAIGSW